MRNDLVRRSNHRWVLPKELLKMHCAVATLEARSRRVTAFAKRYCTVLLFSHLITVSMVTISLPKPNDYSRRGLTPNRQQIKLEYSRWGPFPCNVCVYRITSFFINSKDLSNRTMAVSSRIVFFWNCEGNTLYPRPNNGALNSIDTIGPRVSKFFPGKPTRLLHYNFSYRCRNL